MTITHVIRLEVASALGISEDDVSVRVEDGRIVARVRNYKSLPPWHFRSPLRCYLAPWTTDEPADHPTPPR